MISKKLQAWVFWLSISVGVAQGGAVEDSALAVLKRVMGESGVKKIHLEVMNGEAGKDGYVYEAKGGDLHVKGTSAVAMCRGVYDYLREKELGTVGWAGARVKVPAGWPDAKETRVESPFLVRHCYNVVTFGYSAPYWTWERWQQELDWLAMHGYNMAMAPVATEAIASKVWKELGLTQEEIDEFYTGPAHLPWQRMGNIQAVGGKLTENWHLDQVGLQKKILARMKELGIAPVVQTFAGFAPKGIKRVYPNLVLHETLWNAGFAKSQRPVVMMPDDPVFADIMKRYIGKWKETFGDAKYFLVDSFNEMELPKSDKSPAELLAGYGQKTYEAITAADADAVWVLQGWMFNYQRNIWNKDTVKALCQSVPMDRFLVLDYANDYRPNWNDFAAFEGRPWVMGYVPNMGGKTAQCGKMDFYASQVAKTLASSGKKNLVGFTISGEGIENNEVIYELMSDTAWRKDAVVVEDWLAGYAKNRYGKETPEVTKAWQELKKSVYSSFTPHPTFGWQNMNMGNGSAHRSGAYLQAVRGFLSACQQYEGSKNYQDDAVEMAALVLSIKADEWFALCKQAHQKGDGGLRDRAGERAIALMLEADRLLESHSYLRLARWLEFARSHQGTDAEKDDWERNARQIVTTWGPPVNDYSCRVWSGLIRDFYVPRMKEVLASMKEGRKMDRREWEQKWVSGLGVSKVVAHERAAEVARELVEKAMTESMPRVSDAPKNLVGTWEPGKVNAEWQVVEWPLQVEWLKTLKGVKFEFGKGKHRLQIRKAAVVADGQVIAEDVHDGLTGDHHEKNEYRFSFAKPIQANNGCVLRAEVRTEGGGESSGQVIWVE